MPPVSDATPPVPPASPPPPPPEDLPQKRPLLRSSSMIDVNAPKEEQEVEVEQSAKRARDLSFKPASEEGSKRANIREILTNIAVLHKLLASRVKSELCPEKDGEFVREVEFTFSLSFSETFCAIAKSK